MRRKRRSEAVMMGSRSAQAWCVVTALGVAPGLAQPALAQDFYAGKTLKIIVGLDAGGTVDTLTRTIVGSLRKHIPGHPTIVIQNMPSAAGVGATNFVYEK